MSIINCGECTREVSDKAVSCPHCGAPIASAHESKAAGATLITVQETSKKFKLHILFAALIFWTGLIGAFIQNGTQIPSNSPFHISWYFITGGFIWYLVTRVRIWWHHK